MTRLIDADAVYKILESCEIRKATIGNPLTDWEYGYTCGIERAESEIECATTVDVVPVVRCKDCKFVGTDATCCLVCNRDGMGLRPFHVYHDDFCSYAERKEE